MAFPTQTCNTISVRLDETNYPTWVFQMQHHLRGHGLLKFVDGSHLCPPQFLVTDDGSLKNNSVAREKWMEQDSSVISLIIITLSPDALTLVVGCLTSMEVWLTLKQRYASTSELHNMKLKSTLQSIQKSSDCIEKYLLKFKSARDQLASVGVTISDQDVKGLILAGLPIEYGPTRQIIRGKNDIGMEEVRSLLLSAEYEIELKHKALPLSTIAAMIAQNSLANSSQSMQYGISSTGTSSQAIFPSHYIGNCSMTHALHTAASNVGSLPNVTNTNLIPGIPANNHYNTSSCASNAHHYNAPSPSSTILFGIPQNTMLSSSALSVPNAPPICQDLLPFTTNVDVPQLVSNSGYMLHNSVGNGNYFSSSASSYGYAPQNDNSMVQNGGFMARNGGHIAQNSGYDPTLHHNYSQQQGFSNMFGTTSGSQPAFDTNSLPTFGSTNTIAFGTYTIPAFGQCSSIFGTTTSAPAFGQSSLTFGSTQFGASSPNFVETTPGKTTFSSRLETTVVNNNDQPTSVTSSEDLSKDVVTKSIGNTSDQIKGVVSFSPESDDDSMDENHTDISKRGEKFEDQVKLATNADGIVEINKQNGSNMTEVPFIEAETESDVSDESSFSCLSKNMYKPHEANDGSWIDTLLIKGTWQLPCTSLERPLLNCRQACRPMKLWQLPLIPPG